VTSRLSTEARGPARAGEVYENRVQGDRAVVREGSEDTGGERLVVDLYVRSDGAVAESTFTRTSPSASRCSAAPFASISTAATRSPGRDSRWWFRLLPLALFAREFRREGEFIRPPRIVRRILFALLAPLARARGYKAIHPDYLGPTGKAAGRPDPVEASRAG
jgi:hypothetical protein